MKKFYLSTVFFFAIFIAQAQIVNFPDLNFKNALVNQYCVDTDNNGDPDNDVDTNNDGQVQISEALAVTKLHIQNFGGNFGNSPTNDATGIEAFTNVTSLTVMYFSAHDLDLTAMIYLQTLNVNFNLGLTNVNASNLPSLLSITCDHNNVLSSFNFSGCSNLTSLDFKSNYYLTFDGNLIGLSSLQTLQCLQTGVSSLNFSQTPNLVNLMCTYEPITSINLSGLTQLRNVDVSENNLYSLNTGGLSQLEKLNCNMNHLTSLEVGNLNSLVELQCAGNEIATLNVSALTNLVELGCDRNQIQTLNVSALTNLKKLSCSTNNIAVLDVAPLLQLTLLSCRGNTIQTLAVTDLTNLIYLDCSHNQLSQLAIENLNNLEYLNMEDNAITSANVSTLAHLNSLIVSRNPINTLDVSTLINLYQLSCAQNGLTSLTITQTNNPQLTTLDFGGNPMTSFDFSGCPNLETLKCGDNQFSTLDLSANPHITSAYDFAGENLTYINIKNGVSDAWNFYDFIYCTSLTHVCGDEGDLSEITYQLSSNPDLSNVQISSYCTFNPGGVYNTIAGTQTYDVDNNGCSGSDPYVPWLKIAINDGVTNGATFTNTAGNFSFFTLSGNFVITPVFENAYFTATPVSANINFPSLDGSTQIQNFCVTPLGIHNDVEVILISRGNTRPGYDASYDLIYRNKGNQIQSGNITLNYDDAVLDYVAASPTVDSQATNLLTWNYTNLMPFETKYIYLTLNLNSPTEIPAVNDGDILNFSATIAPVAGDETPDDNTIAYAETVVNSFDPNDKTCLEGNTITPEMVDDYLHYLIRFQNLGTTAAQNVVIKDIIDTTKFDMASLQLTGSSHPQVTKITGNKVEFQFENINLPAEIDDAPGSNGYVAFKIKTKNNLVIGNSVSNKADIYFDYNFPIETNTATSTVALLGVNSFENTSVNVTPNPTKNIVHITSKGNITSVQLFDVQGRILETMTTNDEAVDFDLSQKSSGVYFVKVYTAKGVRVEKLIKE